MVHRRITCPYSSQPPVFVDENGYVRGQKGQYTCWSWGKRKLPFSLSRVGDKPWTKTDVPTFTAVGLCSEQKIYLVHTDAIYFRSVSNYSSVFQVISFMCLPKSCVHFSPMRATSPCPLHPLWFDMQRGIHILNLLIMDFLHVPITSFLLGSNILLYTGVFWRSKHMS
jgi:hypothetical protein